MRAEGRAARRHTGPRLSLALVGATTLLSFWIAPHEPSAPWFSNPTPWLDLAAAALAIALSIRARHAWAAWSAAIVGGAIFAWELVRYLRQDGSNVFAVAFLLIAGAAALQEWRSARRAERAG